MLHAQAGAGTGVAAGAAREQLPELQSIRTVSRSRRRLQQRSFQLHHATAPTPPAAWQRATLSAGAVCSPAGLSFQERPAAVLQGTAVPCCWSTLLQTRP